MNLAGRSGDESSTSRGTPRSQSSRSEGLRELLCWGSLMRQGSGIAAIHAGGSGDRAADPVPASIAIAGIYGHVGQSIYNAAVEAGVSRIFGLDPAVRPA